MRTEPFLGQPGSGPRLDPRPFQNAGQFGIRHTAGAPQRLVQGVAAQTKIDGITKHHDEIGERAPTFREHGHLTEQAESMNAKIRHIEIGSEAFVHPIAANVFRSSMPHPITVEPPRNTACVAAP